MSRFYSKQIMNKTAGKATPLTDTLGAITTGMLPFGQLANVLGGAYGALDRDRYDQQDVGGAFIPGVGAARLKNRLKSQVSKEIRDTENSPNDKDAKPVRHTISEQLSPLTSILASTGVGAGLGKILGNTRGGARLGATVGGTGVLVGAILAALKRRRTAKEQIANDKKSILRDLLIPGVGTYNISKRMGRSQGDRDELEEASKGKSEKSASIAYLNSFNKTAEAAGIHPDDLYKIAFKIPPSVVQMAKRYGQLLVGGDAQKIRSGLSKALANKSVTGPIGLLKANPELAKVLATQGGTALGGMALYKAIT